MKVIPSILTDTAADVLRQVTRLAPYYTHFQIDVTDGSFVPNKTAQVLDILEALKQHKNKPLNDWIFDFDLMVIDYKQAFAEVKMIQKYVTIGTVFFHYSALRQEPLLVEQSIITGIALDPQDQVADLDRNYDIKSVLAIQIMSVKPGLQGNPFLPKVLSKVEQCKTLNYKTKVYLDGAVNDKTIPLILDQTYKPDYICPGSYLSKAENIAERVKELEKLITKTTISSLH